MAREVGEVGLELIKSFEGFRARPYMDPVGIWTVGYGHVIRVGEEVLRGLGKQTTAHVLFPRALTPMDALTLLMEDVDQVADHVSDVIRVELKPNQFDALVSFEYNTGALKGSTMAKLLNRALYRLAAEEFGRWVHADGKVLPGLVRRRAAEKALFLS